MHFTNVNYIPLYIYGGREIREKRDIPLRDSEQFVVFPDAGEMKRNRLPLLGDY